MEILRQATPCTNVQYIQLQSTNKDLKWTVKLKPIMSDFIRDTHRVARAESSIDHLLNMQFSDIENSKFLIEVPIFNYQKLSSGPTHLFYPQTSLVLANWTFRQTALSVSFCVLCVFVFRMYCTLVNWTIRLTAVSLPIQWGLSKLALKHSSMYCCSNDSIPLCFPNEQSKSKAESALFVESHFNARCPLLMDTCLVYTVNQRFT